jgi:hypothetical protein
MHRTYSIRTINTSTRESPRQRRIQGTRKTFASSVGKEDILPTTATRKRIFMVCLEEKTI